jgi:hypothetical protein
MIKIHSIPKDSLDHIPEVKAYLELHPRVLFGYLFGGLAKGKPAPLSDVDIALYLSDCKDIAQEKMEILGRLMEVMKTDEIDLVILNTASLPLRARILGMKKILIDKDPFTRHKFESLTIREYLDFSIKEMEIYRRRYSHGR